MPNIAIFASGAGSNALEIISYLENNNSIISVGLIVTNNESAGIVEIAKRKQIEYRVFKNNYFKSGSDLIKNLIEFKIDWIVLAGFLRRIPIDLVQHFDNKIFNLHPSLLPKYGGKGMFGRNVHSAVIKNREIESGITVHLVNEEYDKGKILFQSKCNIDVEESVDSLVKKIQLLEHKYFPKIIAEHIIKLTN
jgi:phosphoribosylglycinamide formyltransferase-1